MDRGIVRQEFVALEMRAISALCAHWADPRVVAKSSVDDWQGKLLKFREGVVCGIGSGSQEGVPHEIMYSEYRTVHVAVRWAVRSRCWRKRHALSEQTGSVDLAVPYYLRRGRRRLTFRRPFPLPADVATREEYATPVGTNKPSEVAILLAAARVGIQYDTAYNLVYKAQRRMGYRPIQGLLASLSLDLAGAGSEHGRLCNEVFDALMAVNYPPIALHYLAVLAQNVKAPLCGNLPPAKDIRSLCDWCRANRSAKNKVQ